MRLTVKVNSGPLIDKRKGDARANASQALARHQDEDQAQRGGDEEYHAEAHAGALVEQLAHKRLLDPLEAEEGVLRQAGEREDGVEHVLVAGEEVDADCEGEDELEDVSI